MWVHDCGNSACRGVPLFREYLTDAEFTAARPQIRMMGQDTSHYYDGKSLLSVDVDLSGQTSAFTASEPKFCKPQSYCTEKGGSCVCKNSGNGCNDSDCAWGPNDIDCPIDPKNLNGMLCFGFSFTMPPNFTATPMAAADKLFVPFTQNNYFMNGNVTFVNGKSISPMDQCVYDPPPTQP